MTATHDIDRLLATWFAADATDSAPAGLVEAIAGATATTRRRPGWLSLDRWQPVRPQAPIAVRLVALAAILLVVAIASLIVAGSRPRVPPPFGPARPGLFAMGIRGDIVTTSQDGTRQVALTTGEALDTNPAFSRDGTQLAFWSWQLDFTFSELVVMNADGSGRHPIATVTFEDRSSDTAFAWSPDGRFIAYWASPNVKQSQVFVASTDGSGVSTVGDAALRGAIPAWSPDGSMIAFAAGAYDQVRGLYLMHPDGTGVRRISAADGWGDAFAATWSPDGRRLAFTAGSGSTELWMVDVDGSHEHQIDEAAFLRSAAWSPDGRRLTWLHADADLSRPAELRVADAEGTNAKMFPMADLPQFGMNWDSWAPCVGWSADGQYVIGILTPDNSFADRLIELDPDTGESHTIVAPPPFVMAWSQQRLAP